MSDAPAEQGVAAQALQRIRSLRFWRMITDGQHNATFKLHNTAGSVKGVLVATDAKQQLFHVAQLHTPLGVYPYATLRSSDMVDMYCALSRAEIEWLCPQLVNATERRMVSKPSEFSPKRSFQIAAESDNSAAATADAVLRRVIQWASLIGNQVQVHPAKGDSGTTGILYNVDPEISTIVLLQRDGADFLATVVFEPSDVVVDPMQAPGRGRWIVRDATNPRTQAMEFAGAVSAAAIALRKQAVKQTLQNGMVQGVEEGDGGVLRVFGGLLTIEAPYVADSCHCTNETILRRVQTMLQEQLP